MTETDTEIQARAALAAFESNLIQTLRAAHPRAEVIRQAGKVVAVIRPPTRDELATAWNLRDTHPEDAEHNLFRKVALWPEGHAVDAAMDRWPGLVEYAWNVAVYRMAGLACYAELDAGEDEENAARMHPVGEVTPEALEALLADAGVTAESYRSILAEDRKRAPQSRHYWIRVAFYGPDTEAPEKVIALVLRSPTYQEHRSAARMRRQGRRFEALEHLAKVGIVLPAGGWKLTALADYPGMAVALGALVAKDGLDGEARVRGGI